MGETTRSEATDSKCIITLAVNGGTFTYDGQPHAATATAVDGNGITVDGSFAFTYGQGGSSAPPTDVGTYAVTVTFTPDAKYVQPATGSGSVTISPAVPAIAVNGGTFTFDGNAHPATATATGINGNPVAGTFAFTYTQNSVPSNTPPTNAGTYAVTATFTSTDGNYTSPTGTGLITINPAAPVIAVNGGTFTYNGNAHPATATATGVNGNPVAGTFTFIYTQNGSPSTAPVSAGTYSVTAVFTPTDPNYAIATCASSISISQAQPAAVKDLQDAISAVNSEISAGQQPDIHSLSRLAHAISKLTRDREVHEHGRREHHHELLRPVTGKLTGKSGKPVRDYVVELRNCTNNQKHETKTDRDGVYRFYCEEGEYELHAGATSEKVHVGRRPSGSTA